MGIWFLFIFFNYFAYRFVVGQNEIYDYGVNDNEKKEIVDVHNLLRTQIANGEIPNQPAGSNLLQMYWDDQLASTAQEIANSREFEHKLVNDSRFKVGQNLYTWKSTGNFPGANWRSAIYAWFNEYEYYTFNNHSYNHYTQVVWASTYLVGCGYCYYPSEEWHQKLYVCNYGPAGNYIGQYPYQVKTLENQR